MCTAVSFGSFFGRTLDVEADFGQHIIETKKGTAFSFCKTKYHIKGMGLIADSYPLYFDGVNEKGLCMAGLNFPKYACYNHPMENKVNLAPFETIPYILGLCGDVSEAEAVLKNINIENRDFSEKYKTTPMHWIISDNDRTIVAEPLPEGLKIYDNPVGVLTNAPEFDKHLECLNSTEAIPADFESASRFRRAVKAKENAGVPSKEQFYKIMQSVFRPYEKNGEQYTVYTSCINRDTLEYDYINNK